MNARSAADLAVPVTASDHVMGVADAPVTLVEYGDFQCPTCKLAFPAVKMVLQRFGTDVRFAFRHFPLEEPHPLALPAAEAAESAATQDRFWQMHDLLFENQPRFERHHLDEYARRLGLDVMRFGAELDAHLHVGRVRADQASGAKSHIRGTPGFFVNGRIVDISFGMRSLFDAVERALRSE